MTETWTQPALATTQSTNATPNHVGIIMDGNGRWAQARNLPRLAGHRAGVENLRRIIHAAVRYGIRYLSLYAFSTENWMRPEEEVKGLLSLIERALKRELPELHRQGVQLRHLGCLERLPRSTREKVHDAIDLTRHNQRLTLNIAFNYGGRAEITRAIQRILADGVPGADICVELINHYMYTQGQPDPELIIRTGGEMRLSNFLLWQSANALFYASNVHWPDFDEIEFGEALRYFSEAELHRRHPSRTDDLPSPHGVTNQEQSHIV